MKLGSVDERITLVAPAPRKPPKDLREWIRHDAGSTKHWSLDDLLNHPPRYMAVRFQDGTVSYGYISGVRSRFPKVVFEVHGSQLSAEVAPETLVHCLNHKTPISI